MARRQPTPRDGGRVVLYVRVSALMGRGGEDFHSPDIQTDAMRRAATTAGLREVETVEDLDVSGRTFSREGINRIRELVEKRQVDVVAVYDLSRLGRNLSESLTFVKWLREHGVAILSTQERVDSSPEGQFMLGQFLGLAELYGAQVGRRWAQTHERVARLGRAHGIAAVGYHRDDSKHLVVDPVLGPAVTAAFTAYARGDSVTSIAAEFGRARGRPIRKGGLKKLLRNPLYNGRIVLDSATAGTLDLPGRHPQLVDDDTWRKVQMRIAADAVTPPRFLEPAYSLTGLMRCAHCGGSLQVFHTSEYGRSNRTRRVGCARSKETKSCVGVGGPRYERVEIVVLGAVAAYAQHLKSNPTVERRDERAAARETHDAEQALERSRAAMARLTERWARGDVPDDAFESALKRLRDDETAQSTRASQARADVEEPEPAVVYGLTEELLRLWPDLTEGERNRALRSILTGFTMRRAEYWREPESARVGGFAWRWPFGMDT